MTGREKAMPHGAKPFESINTREEVVRLFGLFRGTLDLAKVIREKAPDPLKEKAWTSERLNPA
jgi:hypothetical protein